MIGYCQLLGGVFQRLNGVLLPEREKASAANGCHGPTEAPLIFVLELFRPQGLGGVSKGSFEGMPASYQGSEAQSDNQGPNE